MVVTHSRVCSYAMAVAIMVSFMGHHSFMGHSSCMQQARNVTVDDPVQVHNDRGKRRLGE